MGSSCAPGQRRNMLRVVDAPERLEFVLRRCLPSQPERPFPQVLAVDRWAAEIGHIPQPAGIRVVEQAGRELRRAAEGIGRVEPEAIRRDRPADRRSDVPGLVHLHGAVLAAPDAAIDQLLVHVVAQPARLREVGVEPAAERVAAFLRDQVQAHAAGLDLGHVGGVVVDVLGDGGVERRPLGRPLEGHQVDVESVEHHRGVRVARAVNRQPVVAHAGDAARVGRDGRRRAALDVHGRDQQRHRVIGPRRGQRLEDLAVDRLVARDVLHVDDRGRLGDGNRLLQRADGKLRVNVRGEAGAQLDALAHKRAEAGQSKGDRVAAGFERNNLELPTAVRNGGPHLLDQRGAAGFHRHAGQHAARGVGYRAADGLRAGQSGEQQEAGETGQHRLPQTASCAGSAVVPRCCR